MVAEDRRLPRRALGIPPRGRQLIADLEHAEPGDTDLHGDALNWSQRFALRFNVEKRSRPLPIVGITQEDAEFTSGVMLTWFASAIETGKMVQAAAEQAPDDDAVSMLLPPPGGVRILWNDAGDIAMVDTDRGVFADVSLMNQLPRLLDEAMTKVRGDDGNDEI